MLDRRLSHAIDRHQSCSRGNDAILRIAELIRRRYRNSPCKRRPNWTLRRAVFTEQLMQAYSYRSNCLASLCSPLRSPCRQPCRRKCPDSEMGRWRIAARNGGSSNCVGEHRYHAVSTQRDRHVTHCTCVSRVRLHFAVARKRVRLVQTWPRPRFSQHGSMDGLHGCRH